MIDFYVNFHFFLMKILTGYNGGQVTPEAASHGTLVITYHKPCMSDKYNK